MSIPVLGEKGLGALPGEGEAGELARFLAFLSRSLFLLFPLEHEHRVAVEVRRQGSGGDGHGRQKAKSPLGGGLWVYFG